MKLNFLNFLNFQGSTDIDFFLDFQLSDLLMGPQGFKQEIHSLLGDV